jgi:hypothetical protein
LFRIEEEAKHEAFTENRKEVVREKLFLDFNAHILLEQEIQNLSSQIPSISSKILRYFLPSFLDIKSERGTKEIQMQVEKLKTKSSILSYEIKKDLNALGFSEDMFNIFQKSLKDNITHINLGEDKIVETIEKRNSAFEESLREDYLNLKTLKETHHGYKDCRLTKMRWRPLGCHEREETSEEVAFLSRYIDEKLKYFGKTSFDKFNSDINDINDEKISKAKSYFLKIRKSLERKFLKDNYLYIQYLQRHKYLSEKKNKTTTETEEYKKLNDLYKQVKFKFEKIISNNWMTHYVDPLGRYEEEEDNETRHKKWYNVYLVENDENDENYENYKEISFFKYLEEFNEKLFYS